MKPYIHIMKNHETTLCGIEHVDENPYLYQAATLALAKQYAGLSVGEQIVCDDCEQVLELTEND